MSCSKCTTVALCCQKFHADGACCGGGDMIAVPCAAHAIIQHKTREIAQQLASKFRAHMPAVGETESEAA